MRLRFFYGDTRKKFCKIKINPYLCDVIHIQSLYRGAFFPETVPHTDSAERNLPRFAVPVRIGNSAPGDVYDRAWAFLYFLLMSYKATAPTQKGIKATTEAIENILEGSAQLQMCLNL